MIWINLFIFFIKIIPSIFIKVYHETGIKKKIREVKNWNKKEYIYILYIFLLYNINKMNRNWKNKKY